MLVYPVLLRRRTARTCGWPNRPSGTSCASSTANRDDRLTVDRGRAVRGRGGLDRGDRLCTEFGCPAPPPTSSSPRAPWAAQWNAAAISGEYLSAASFLGVAGLIAKYGADALWYPVGFTAGYLGLLLFVAAPLRRSGAYTVPDFAEFRLARRGCARSRCSSSW